MAVKNDVSTTYSMNYMVGVTINDILYNKYEVNASNNKIEFTIDTDNLKVQEYTIKLIRLSETSFTAGVSGFTAIERIDVSNGELLPKKLTSKNDHKFLFIGDSITAAYGVYGADPCGFDQYTESVLASYASIISEEYFNHAEYHVIAWSGKGVVRNYGDVDSVSTTSPTMPIMYNLSIATDPTSYWKPTNYLPTEIFILLGTNDYSTTPYPSDEDFTNGYIAFMNQIFRDYPSIKRLYAMCAPLQNNNQCSNIENAVKTVTNDRVTYIDIVDSVIAAGPAGCDGHPSVTTQQNMAKFIFNSMVH
jgi:hypothetical protein